MNKIMQNMMKPILVSENTDADIRRKQEAIVMDYLTKAKNSVMAYHVACANLNIPRIRQRGWGNNTMNGDTRSVSKVLQRLEKNGKILSMLYGRGRYYSVPVDNSEDDRTPAEKMGVPPYV